jgi:hypothetical protein
MCKHVYTEHCIHAHMYSQAYAYARKQWGATGVLRPLKTHQVACAVYNCPPHLTDTELSARDYALVKERFPGERISLTLPMVNNAREILVTVSQIICAPKTLMNKCLIIIMCAHVDVCLQAHVDVCLQAHVDVCLQAHVDVCLQAHVDVCLQAHVDVCLQAHCFVDYIPTYIHTDLHTYIHTHTHPRVSCGFVCESAMQASLSSQLHIRSSFSLAIVNVVLHCFLMVPHLV